MTGKRNPEPICPRCIALEWLRESLDQDDSDRAAFALRDLDLVAVNPYAFCERHALDACGECGSSRESCERVWPEQRKCCPDCEHGVG